LERATGIGTSRGVSFSAAVLSARHFAVGDRLDLERMQAGEGRDLIERERRVLDQPDGGRLGH